MPFGWLSNNSIYAELGMDYSKLVKNISDNGEPGFLWLDNMQNYSRMCDEPDFKDIKATGGNPCLEQTLESYEMCCLSETFPHHHETIDEYLETLRIAFLYAKIVTLGLTHWEESNLVMSRNRRIGLSMTGIAQFLTKFGYGNLKLWCEKGYKHLKIYDKSISKRFCVNESIKITSIKPSGTVSLLGGATPGIHFPLSRFYIRRVRVSNKSELLQNLLENGFEVEPDKMQPDSTMVVSFPIDQGEGVKTLKETNIWEQISLAAFMQNYWADNQVSCTVSFSKKNESSQLQSVLDLFQYKLKGISFLPILEDSTPYPQMPYEEIDEETYNLMTEKIKNKRNKYSNNNDKDGNIINKKKGLFSRADGEGSNFCDSDKCDI
jgi:ribonucleoside-triphosphate reductase